MESITWFFSSIRLQAAPSLDLNHHGDKYWDYGSIVAQFREYRTIAMAENRVINGAIDRTIHIPLFVKTFPAPGVRYLYHAVQH